jgi:hypothetical protein
MSDVIKVLYEKFFMRDLLGKIGPGFAATVAVLKALNVELTSLMLGKDALWLLWVASIPIIYIIGLSLQILAELVGIHSASPKPRYIFLKSSTGNWKKANDDFDLRLTKIRKATSIEWGDGAKEQRERFVYLKEGSGNFAMASIIVIISLLFKKPIEQMCDIFILIGLSLVLYASHVIHAKRQARFEIRTLFESGLIDNKMAEEMLSRT